MPFNSLKYFLFLPVVYLVFCFVGEKWRWCVLLAASLLFYATLNVPYLIIVLALVVTTTYFFGIWLDQTTSPKSKCFLLWGGVVSNTVVLICMKYLPFLSENLQTLTTLFHFGTHIQPVKAFVAIGVSYYVFQAMSYLFDIYLEIEKPERHFGYFALYLAFFPKLLQGPIERAGELLPQLKSRYEFNYDNIRSGLLLFAWGLFKKVAIADRLGLYVDAVYNNVHAYTGLSLILGTYAYAFQIYMDFSGYTDMALGSARLFNINLTQNFNSPYLATSVADFWRRWHISFSRWILDYIFKPLQMRWRDSKNWGTAAALLAAFLISGVWHGASWGFVIWGGLHGIYMACSVLYRPYQKRLHKFLGVNSKLLRVWHIFVTFNLVSFTWVFFRANDLSDALYVVTNMHNLFNNYQLKFLFLQGGWNLFSVALSLTIIVIYLLLSSDNLMFRKFENIFLLRWTAYVFLILAILVFWTANKSFIYFNF